MLTPKIEGDSSPWGEILRGIDGAEGVEITKTELRIDPDLPLATWVSLVSRLASIESQIPWLIGDAVAYGEATYGRATAYKALAKASGRSLHTLENRVSIAKSVVPSVRDTRLSWSHHREVAA